MVRPSPVQYHATVMVTIALVLLGLAAFAFLSRQGVGPFEAVVQRHTVLPGERVETVVVVENGGSKAARATCQVIALDATGKRQAVTTLLTPQIPGGESVAVRTTLEGLGADPAAFRVDCS
jgi:hypothetical protein